jgi:hypothetical protein
MRGCSVKKEVLGVELRKGREPLSYTPTLCWISSERTDAHLVRYITNEQ